MSSKTLNKKQKYISSTQDKLKYEEKLKYENKLKYVINNGDAKIEKIKFGNRKELQNVLAIGDKSYRYNSENMTKVLKSKLKITIKTDDSGQNKLVIKNKTKKTILDN